MVLQRADGSKVWLAKSLSVAVAFPDDMSIALPSGVLMAEVNRPGFDLGGSTGETHAGKGLGLGTDAEKNRKGWGLPR